MKEDVWEVLRDTITHGNRRWRIETTPAVMSSGVRVRVSQLGQSEVVYTFYLRFANGKISDARFMERHKPSLFAAVKSALGVK